MRKLLLLACVFVALSSVAQNTTAPPLQTVPTVDLDRYMGRWFQIALYPNSFQKQCLRNTVATYRKLESGNVEVLNTCVKADNKKEEALGLARPVSPAKLQVSFLPSWLRWTGIGWGNYWVIQIASESNGDYRYAVISEPKREFLWILARTPQLSPADDAAIRAKLVEQGFDLTKLQLHPQL